MTRIAIYRRRKAVACGHAHQVTGPFVLFYGDLVLYGLDREKLFCADTGHSLSSRGESMQPHHPVPSSTEPRHQAGGDMAHFHWALDGVRHPHRIILS
ncbi:hypothetical protein M5K25_016787 [Dendrobium thyrsiflorum]|uniref:Uncharacterized protein n=1 Tax=Dendrobium thyrsiflorum TaxID=117978 RepID=A0ABD0UL41_DENTH